MFKSICKPAKLAILTTLALVATAQTSEAQLRTHPSGLGGNRVVIGLRIGSPWYYSPYWGGGYYYDMPYFGPYNYSYSSQYFYSYYYPPQIVDFTHLYAYQWSNPPPAGKPREDNVAKIEITLPESATLWFDGKKTSQSGAARYFATPALTPGQVFFYDVQATWIDKSGEQVSRKRTVEVYAGQQVKADLLQAE